MSIWLTCSITISLAVFGWFAGILIHALEEAHKANEQAADNWMKEKARQEDLAKADRLIAIMKEIGMDAEKAAENPLAVDIARKWRNGDTDDLQLMRSLNNLLIMNPKLKC